MINNKRCILVVDDEIRIVKVLKDFLTANNFYILEAYNGEEALDIFYENNSKIDIILMDIMMPKIDGYEVLSEIRKSSLIPVIMLTAKGQEYDEIKGFNLGSDDYIVKPFSPTLLLARIEAVLKRIGKSEDNTLTIGPISINSVQRTVKVDNTYLDLTRREFDLLAFLITNKGIALTREQLLNEVWGYDFEGEMRTVDTHIKQLRNKLKDYDFIKTVHRVGYKFSID